MSGSVSRSFASIYDDFYSRIVAECVPGTTIEIGGGIGNLKRRLPQLFSTDIQFARWLDCVADAQSAVSSEFGCEHCHGRRIAPLGVPVAFFFARPRGCCVEEGGF